MPRQSTKSATAHAKQVNARAKSNGTGYEAPKSKDTNAIYNPNGGRGVAAHSFYTEADKSAHWAAKAKADAAKKLAYLDRELKPITNVGKQMQHLVSILRKQGMNARDAQIKAAQLLKAYHQAKSLVTA